MRLFLPLSQGFHFLCYEQRSKGLNFSPDFKKEFIRIQTPQNSVPQTCFKAMLKRVFPAQTHPCVAPVPVTSLKKVSLCQGYRTFIQKIGTRGNPETPVATGDGDSNRGVQAAPEPRDFCSQPFQTQVASHGGSKAVPPVYDFPKPASPLLHLPLRNKDSSLESAVLCCHGNKEALLPNSVYLVSKLDLGKKPALQG